MNIPAPTPSASTRAQSALPALPNATVPIGYAVEQETTAPKHQSIERSARFVLTVFLAFYGFSILKHPDLSDALYNVDVPIHEFGHYLFWPFGQFMHVAGGTIFELLFPCTFLVYFARRKDYHAASVILWWVAQNLWDISVYAADAVATELPLLGGGFGDADVTHDWSYMLGRLGVLGQDQQIAHRIWVAGVILFLIAIAGGLIALTEKIPKNDESAETSEVA